MTNELLDMLRRCNLELTKILEWHIVESIPLRTRELNSIRGLVKEASELLSRSNDKESESRLVFEI